MHIACIAGEKTLEYFIQAFKNGREEDVYLLTRASSKVRTN